MRERLAIRRVAAPLGGEASDWPQAAAPDDPPSASAKQTATSAETPAPRIKAKVADAAPSEKTSRGQAKTILHDAKDTGDPLTADVLGDADLANQRGGSETHLNQNNTTGAVTGN